MLYLNIGDYAAEQLCDALEGHYNFKDLEEGKTYQLDIQFLATLPDLNAVDREQILECGTSPSDEVIVTIRKRYPYSLDIKISPMEGKVYMGMEFPLGKAAWRKVRMSKDPKKIQSFRRTLSKPNWEEEAIAELVRPEKDIIDPTEDYFLKKYIDEY